MVTASASGYQSQSKAFEVAENQVTENAEFSLASSGGYDGGGGPPPCKGKNKNDPGC